ncbi:hypothetical protein [Marinomonas gallaica]
MLVKDDKVNSDGRITSMPTFSESAPDGELFNMFGFNTEAS